ncbi:hypothetical protein ACT3SZ_15615 [Corynebacterium sp. AOP40-9SA-29]|uniref:hypothetical protein n=1 Tax=Corynebacterium sp. AOP40-9SA-29 TaxID=3457677 RepID=UPI0040332B72
MSDAETLSTLAHELAHMAHGDPCGASQAAEDRAWRTAAEWIVSPEEYANAENAYGPHPQLIAAEIGVTRHVVEVWRKSREPLPVRAHYELLPN